ncbi:hypothetical protein L21SP4_01112 [Kiritimatiella glycovorans]|uniref:TonB C-terminal domain-containing protein n=2 Tax=Kiritimatiella glycovorans TaxID=1307763 RepID=A0A0G3EJR1_9BACT|nr:hypothetical protein L21SP4_01112 [Kiritimatiella glycovorans]
MSAALAVSAGLHVLAYRWAPPSSRVSPPEAELAAGRTVLTMRLAPSAPADQSQKDRRAPEKAEETESAARPEQTRKAEPEPARETDPPPQHTSPKQPPPEQNETERPERTEPAADDVEPEPSPDEPRERPDPAPAEPAVEEDSPNPQAEASASSAAPQGTERPAPVEGRIVPDYPLLSRKRGEEGTVTLEVHVSAEGKPERVTVSDGSGHRRLDRAAVRAVRRTSFRPARRNGRPVPMTYTQRITFRLEKSP